MHSITCFQVKDKSQTPVLYTLLPPLPFIYSKTQVNLLAQWVKNHCKLFIFCQKRPTLGVSKVVFFKVFMVLFDKIITYCVLAIGAHKHKAFFSNVKHDHMYVLQCCFHSLVKPILAYNLTILQSSFTLSA